MCRYEIEFSSDIPKYLAISIHIKIFSRFKLDFSLKIRFVVVKIPNNNISTTLNIPNPTEDKISIHLFSLKLRSIYSFSSLFLEYTS